MANPQNLRPWRKGQSGNIAGRPRNLLTKDKVKSVMGVLVDKSIGELEEIVASRTEPALKIVISSILIRAIRDGDASRLELLLARAVGKVRDEVEVIDHSDVDAIFDAAPREELMAFLRKINGTQ